MDEIALAKQKALDAKDKQESKKVLPFGAWLLCIFLGAGVLIGIGKAIFAYRLADFSDFQIMIWILTNGFGICLIVALLRFKKSSFWFFAIMELLSYLTIVTNLFTKSNELANVESGAVFAYVIFRLIITALILGYIHTLTDKKILT